MGRSKGIYGNFYPGRKAPFASEDRTAYDTTRAKTVLAVVGVALVLVLLWLDYKGF